MNFELRDVVADDHKWLVNLHNDPLVLRNITNPEPITLESHINWWNSLDKEREKRSIFYIDGERAGFCKFYNIDKTYKDCLLGADLQIDYRGKNYAKHMWKLIVDYCFNELDLDIIYLTVAEYNKIAIHVYESIGFDKIGIIPKSLYRDDKYYDQFKMAMNKEKWVE